MKLITFLEMDRLAKQISMFLMEYRRLKINPLKPKIKTI